MHGRGVPVHGERLDQTAVADSRPYAAAPAPGHPRPHVPVPVSCWRLLAGGGDQGAGGRIPGRPARECQQSGRRAVRGDPGDRAGAVLISLDGDDRGTGGRGDAQRRRRSADDHGRQHRHHHHQHPRVPGVDHPQRRIPARVRCGNPTRPLQHHRGADLPAAADLYGLPLDGGVLACRSPRRQRGWGQDA